MATASDIAAAGRVVHTGAGTGSPDASASRRKFSRRPSFPIAFLDAQEPTEAEEAWAFLEEAASRQERLAKAKATFLDGGGNETKWTQMRGEVTKAKVTRATYRQDRRDPESKLNWVRADIARIRELDRARVESPTAVPRPPSSPPFGVCICGYFGDYEQVQEHLAHPNNVGTGHHKLADFW